MKRFLIISSRPPCHSAGLGNDIAKALVDGGDKVDFLTLRYFSSGKDELYGGGRLIYSEATPWAKPDGLVGKVWEKIQKRYYNCCYRLSGAKALLYPYEWSPAVAPESYLKLLDRGYDAVVTLFWQDMLNTTSLRRIYRKLKCPILVYSPDMAPFTGGCFYPEDCRRFTVGCGQCPKIGKGMLNDVTRCNFKIKRKNYRKTEVVFMSNTWVKRQAVESGLFPPGHVSQAEIVLDDSFFTPGSDKKVETDGRGFTILLRSSDEPRKGNGAMLEALTLFCSHLPVEERSHIRVLAIGDSYFSRIAEDSDFKVESLGFVDSRRLVELYRRVDIFMSLSLNDAGPSMINQALMCGCPVVSFNNGTAEDVVVNGLTGYKSEIGDIAGIAESLARLYSMGTEEKKAMTRECRTMALRHNSIPAFAISVRRALDTFGLPK